MDDLKAKKRSKPPKGNARINGRIESKKAWRNQLITWGSPQKMESPEE